MRLKDKICVVTGGGSGIGHATSLLFSREGAQLVVADKVSQAAKNVAAEAGTVSGGTLCRPANRIGSN